MAVANVDKELHNPEVTNANLIKERTTSKPKKSLRGAAGGSYIGPVISTAARADSLDGSSYATASDSHAVGIAGGGVEDTTGYRKSDLYTRGTGTDAATRTIRPNPGNQTARGMYRANGVFGGSIPGLPAQRSGQRAVAAAGGGELTAEGAAPVFMDKRSNIYGDGGDAIGSAGRGTREANGTVQVAAAGAAREANQRFIDRPVMVTAADPSAGEIEINGAAGAIHADLNAADITAGANVLAGCVIYVFERNTDTDEDKPDMVRKGDFDSVTEGAVTGLTTMTAATYSVYAAFKDPNGNIGPWSARTTVVVT